MTLSFFGTIRQGVLANSAPAGYSFTAYAIPQRTDLVSMQYPAEDFDQVNAWLPGSQVFDQALTYFGGVWYNNVPSPDPGDFLIGEGFMLNSVGPKEWTRTFSVW
jgi:hypothetical protein